MWRIFFCHSEGVPLKVGWPKNLWILLLARIRMTARVEVLDLCCRALKARLRVLFDMVSKE